jgi:hypothetical protein
VDVYWGVLVAGLVAVVFVWSLRDGAQTPERWGRLYRPELWRWVLRAIALVLALALVAARLLGADATVYAIIVVAGVSATYVAWRFASQAWWNDLLHRLLKR